MTLRPLPRDAQTITYRQLRSTLERLWSTEPSLRPNPDMHDYQLTYPPAVQIQTPAIAARRHPSNSSSSPSATSRPPAITSTLLLRLSLPLLLPPRAHHQAQRRSHGSLHRRARPRDADLQPASSASPTGEQSTPPQRATRDLTFDLLYSPVTRVRSHEHKYGPEIMRRHRELLRAEFAGAMNTRRELGRRYRGIEAWLA